MPGFIFLLLGVVSQLYVGRLYSVNRKWLLGLAAFELLISATSLEQIGGFVHHYISPWLAEGVISGLLGLWYWVITFAAVVLWLKNRVRTPAFNPERRALLVSAAPAVVLATGFIIRKDFVIREVDLKFPNLPKDLQGLRIAQISDIHMGDFFSAADLARVVDMTNGLRAELIFVTGDLISDKYDPLDRCLLELKRLRAPSGVWGCMGNHEMHADCENYTAAKALEYDIRFLRHEAERLSFGQSKLNLAGVDHQRRNMPYLVGAEDLIVPGEFNLLLSHNPDVFPIAVQKGFNLTLSGHTHGGQINLPFPDGNLNITDLITPFTKGFYKLKDSALYVNSGLGTIGVPVRLGAPPEITLIRLCNS